MYTNKVRPLGAHRRHLRWRPFIQPLYKPAIKNLQKLHKYRVFFMIVTLLNRILQCILIRCAPRGRTYVIKKCVNVLCHGYAYLINAHNIIIVNTFLKCVNQCINAVFQTNVFIIHIKCPRKLKWCALQGFQAF